MTINRRIIEKVSRLFNNEIVLYCMNFVILSTWTPLFHFNTTASNINQALIKPLKHLNISSSQNDLCLRSHQTREKLMLLCPYTVSNIFKKLTWYHLCLLQPRRQHPARHVQPSCRWRSGGPQGSGWGPRGRCCWDETSLSALICARLVRDKTKQDQLGFLFKGQKDNLSKREMKWFICKKNQLSNQLNQ